MTKPNTDDEIIERAATTLNEVADRYGLTVDDPIAWAAAALMEHGFAVTDARQSKEVIKDGDDLWAEMITPSIWIHDRSVVALVRELRKDIQQRNTPKYQRKSNRVITANLKEQRRLFNLLEEFYLDHAAPSLYSRLIVEPIYDQGESILTLQGADIKVVASTTEQRRWHKEGQTELRAFARFLADKL